MAKGERTTASTIWQVLASALLGSVMALIVGYLNFVRDLYRDMAALEGRLNQRISLLEQPASVPTQSGTRPGGPGYGAGGVVNMDALQVTATTAESPLSVSSPVSIEWSSGRNMVVQVHDHQASGAILFPPRSPHEQSSSGVTIPLRPGKYEIKSWVPGTQAFKAAWIEVRGDRPPILDEER